MKILVFDNYDSFTYNLVHLIAKITGKYPDVYRNDQIDLAKVAEYDKIVLSPGPGIPVEAGLLKALIQEYASSKCILGVCLGHQAIGEVFGATLMNLPKVYHGIATPVFPQPLGNGQYSLLYSGLGDSVEVGRYHSWAVSAEDFPEVLEVTAKDVNGLIMGLMHKNYDVEGVQFHPESILTPQGETIMHNWLNK